VTALFFFIAVVSLFPFALGGTPEALRPAAAGIVWVAALLAALLSLESIWHRDAEDGTFDLLLLSPTPPLYIVCAKAVAHWVLTGLPLALAGTVAAVMLFLPLGALPVLLASLMLGTIYMSCLGALCAALTLSARRPGLLLALLVLPLFVPMLIFGVMGVEAFVAGLPAKPYLLLQLALVVAAAGLAPIAAAAFMETHLRSS
jgi:heme exporter protein B